MENTLMFPILQRLMMWLVVILFISCALSTPEPEYALQVTPVASKYAQSIPMRRFVAMGYSQIPAEEINEYRQTYCQQSAAEREELLPHYLNKGVFGYAILEATPDAVYLNGEKVLSLDNGQYTGEIEDYRIPPLDEKLDELWTAQSEWAKACQLEEVKGELLMVVDSSLSFSLIRELLYNAGQNRFGEFYFLVQGQALEPVSSANENRNIVGQEVAVSLLDSSKVRVVSADKLGISDEINLDTTIAGLKTAIDGRPQEESVGCSVVTPAPKVSWSDLASLLGTLQQMGSQKNTLLGGNRVATIGQKIAKNKSVSGKPKAIHWNARLSVLPISLPRFLPPCVNRGAYGPKISEGCNKNCGSPIFSGAALDKALEDIPSRSASHSEE